jgi:hypothetical protein
MICIGEPRDLNKDPQSVVCFSKLNFNIMTERLGSRQFPEQNALPNSDGIFILHRHNDDNVEISPEQQRQLDEIDQEGIMKGKNCHMHHHHHRQHQQ